MFALSINCLFRGIPKLSAIFLVLAAWFYSQAGTCFADQLPLLPIAPEPGHTIGPAQVNLGKFATVNIPEGYRFLDANSARSQLLRMKSSVPRGLAGILVASNWFAIVDYQKLGYVRTTKNDTIDSAAVLAVVLEHLKSQNVDRAQKALAPITSVSWETEPVFDASQGTISCAYLAETVTGPVRNQNVYILGRRGHLNLTIVPMQQSGSEPVSLNEVMSNVAFVEGERYSDYVRGDDIAALSLTELITYDGKMQAKAGLFAHVAFWAGAAAAMILAAGVAALLIVRRAKRQKAKSSPHGINGRHYVNGSYKNGSGNGLIKTLFGHNGHRRANAKRTFNYHKYYSDLMSQVSYGSYGTVPLVNGHSVKRTNGESAAQESRNGHTVNSVQHSQMTLFSSTDLVSELIANQKSLIEEQKRLLQQQTKLIEEKTRLIEEKSKMMEQQSELIGSNLL